MQQDKERRYQILIQQITILSLYWEEGNSKTREFYINQILDEMIEIRKEKMKNDKK
jgi:hypothetical protein